MVMYGLPLEKPKRLLRVAVSLISWAELHGGGGGGDGWVVSFFFLPLLL